MNASHRDLADPQHWERSLERSLHRRAIAPEVRRSVARRRRASVALTTLMAAGPTGGLLSAAGLGRGADPAQASPATRAIETTPATQAAAMLRLGSRGSAVAEVQRELGIAVDGIFGPVTDAAVRDFQRQEGLLVDGIVGPVTWTELFGLEQAAAAMAQTGDGNVAVIVRERTDAGARRTAALAPSPAPAAPQGGDVGGDRHRHGAGETVPAVGGDAAPRPVARVDAPEPPRSAPVSRPAPDRGGACGALRLRTPVRGTVTSSFGPRWGRHHAGIDIAAPTGTPIRAAECGVVSFSGAQSGYGNMVCVKHSSRFETCYAHMTRSTVRSGQKVDKGNVIGYVGCTGSCTGPHVHFETRVDGTARDPRHYLAGGSVPGTPTVRAAAVGGKATAASTATATPAETASGARTAAGIATTAGGATAPTTPAPEPMQPAPTEAAPVVDDAAPESAVAPEPTTVPVPEPAPERTPEAIAPQPAPEAEAVTEPAPAPEPVAPEPAPEPVEPTTTAPAAEVPTTPQPSPDPQPAPSPQPTPPPSPQPTPDPSPQPTPPAPEPIPTPDPVPEPTPDPTPDSE